MEIRVSGHQIDTGEALRTHVEQRLETMAEKYFARTISAHVTFGKGPYEHSFRSDIVLHVMQGLILRGEGSTGDAHAAFDQAAGRIEKQLRRYMRRLKDRHHQGNGEVADLPEPVAGYTVFQAGDEESEEAEDNPPIIAETRVDIPDTSVSDAVMMLDLRDTNALLFRNSGTGSYNMVYRRRDGTIGWVEPGRAA